MTLKKIKQVLFNKGEDPDEPQMYQNILLEFNGSVEVMATVKAFCFKEDELGDLHLTMIKVTEPKELPEGLSFPEV
jgi:hypothetical protein